MKQYIHNACGAIALVHGIANNSEYVVFGILTEFQIFHFIFTLSSFCRLNFFFTQY